jgi:hypothetical protein
VDEFGHFGSEEGLSSSKGWVGLGERCKAISKQCW